ncbi:aldo/keto reductase [Streptomyces sp. NPDC059340]|uniref:aldo/keto reductase n=1 Tax=Streptomyces sp. NPDC059340 TaxID=3346806 RepID=UPI0036C45C64
MPHLHERNRAQSESAPVTAVLAPDRDDHEHAGLIAPHNTQLKDYLSADEGKLRYLGISEASPATIRAAHTVAPLSAVQTEHSLFSRNVEVNGVLDTVRELGIGFVAYAPLGRGFLTGAVRSVYDLPTHDFRRTSSRFADANLEQNLSLLDRIVETAANLGVTTGQLALAWVLAQDGVTALPGTKRRTWLEQNVAAASELGSATIAGLSAAIPVGAAAGDRYAPMGMASIQE